MVYSAKLTNHVISEGANNFKSRHFSPVFCIVMNFLHICHLLMPLHYIVHLEKKRFLSVVKITPCATNTSMAYRVIVPNL